MLKLIIWDLDGTLVNSLPSTLAAINDGVEEHVGRRLSDSEIVKHFGRGEQHILAQLVGQDKAAACYNKMLASIESRLKDILPFDGVLDALDAAAAAGLRTAIFTGRSRRATHVILNGLRLSERFSLIVTDDDVTHHKPHPEGIYKICRELATSPSDALMIGDSHLDVLAGRTAGARTAGCTWDAMASRERLAEAMPSHIVNHPSEIRALF